MRTQEILRALRDKLGELYKDLPMEARIIKVESDINQLKSDLQMGKINDSVQLKSISKGPEGHKE
jgi:hypothetical protein